MTVGVGPANTAFVGIDLDKQDHDPYAPPSEGADRFEPPELGDGVQVLASRGNRLVGAILDGLLINGLAMIALFAGGFPHVPMDDNPYMLEVGILILVPSAIQWWLIATRAQSVGKILLQMKIVDNSDRPISGFSDGVVLRAWVPGLIGYFIAIFHLFDALWIFGEERRCLHDRIAGTKVIQL